MLLNDLLIDLSYKDLDMKVSINSKDSWEIFHGTVEACEKSLSYALLTREILFKCNIENTLYIEIDVKLEF